MVLEALFFFNIDRLYGLGGFFTDFKKLYSLVG